MPAADVPADPTATIAAAAASIGIPPDVRAAHAEAAALAAMGLCGPARDLLAAFPDDADARALADRLAARPSGRAPWSGLQARFESHLERVSAVHSGLRRHAADFRAVPRRLELFRSRDGGLHLARPPVNGRREWIGGLADPTPVIESMKLPHDPAAPFCAPYVVLGDVRGTLLDRVHRATRTMFLTFTPHIFVVEPDPTLFGAQLFLREAFDALLDPRVVPLVGADWRSQLDAFLTRHPLVPIPDHVVAPPGTPRSLIDDAIAALRAAAGRRAQVAAATVRELASHYDPLPPDHWKARFAARPAAGESARPPLCVLGVTSRYTTVLQHSMRDLGRALTALGCRFELLIEATDHEMVGRDAIAAAVLRTRPDLVFIIDHHRHEYGGAIPRNLPFVCWIQDLLPHLMRPEVGAALGPLDFFIAPELDQFTRAYRYPARQGLASPMTTSQDTYSADPLPDEVLAPCRCDFSFVSNQAVTPQRFREEWLTKFRAGPEAARLTQFLLAALHDEFDADPRTAFCRPVDTLLDQAARDTGIAPATPRQADHLARSFIHPAAELIFRQRTLQWVADYCDRSGRSLHLYGNGWDAHPRFAAYARGAVPNGQPLRAVYQASAINLQIIGSGAIHQRLLDGLAAGGFFLCRYTPADHLAGPARNLLAALDLDPRDDARLLAALRDLDTLHGAPPRDAPNVPDWEIRRYREHAAQEFARVASCVLPDYDRVTFASPDEFAARADFFLAHPDARREIAAPQRDAVLRRYTCDALVQRLLALIRSRL